MNIIVIVSDTLRRDHLPCYGNAAIIAPNLDAFAKKSLVFEDSYPSSFPTVPARADLMTGRYTFTYLPWGPLPQSEITLAQCLKGAGYVTAAIADTPFLARNGYGLDRGFQEFIYVRGQLEGTQREYLRLNRPASEELGYCAAKTLKGAADWLYRHHQEKFFLYIDTWDPHEPWDPPSYYVKPYLPDYAGEVITPNYWDYRADGLSEKDIQIAHACYCGEISMVDYWFGFLLERIRVLNLLDDTVIIFTSDHGFYFGERGQFGKRRFRWPDGSPNEGGFAKGYTLADQVVYRSALHNEITEIPLLMYLPGHRPRRIPGLVTIPDLMPTILEIADIGIPDCVQAKSILPLIKNKTSSIHDFAVTSAPFEEEGQLSKTVDDCEREVFEISPSSITDGQWDLLYGVSGQPVELYRTKEDPGHLKNLASENQDVVERLHAQFITWLNGLGVKEDFLAPRRGL